MNTKQHTRTTLFRRWWFWASVGLVVLIFAISLFVVGDLKQKGSKPAMAESTIADQECTYVGDETSFTTIRNDDAYGQTFVVKNVGQITTIKLLLGAYPGDFNGTITVSLTRLSDSQTFTGQTLDFSASPMLYPYDTWYTFQFGSQAPKVSIGEKLRINIINSSGSWYQFFEINTNLSNCNTSGSITENGVENDFYDFNFQVIGYPPTPVAADVSNDNPAGTTTSSNGSSVAPATKTSSSIKSPSNLVALYEADKNDIKLTWSKSSSTNITGYRIFRSEQKATGFNKVGEVNKDIVEYADNKNLIAEKTYYYFVRAIKDNEESASSNTVEIAIPKTVAPVINQADTSQVSAFNPTAKTNNWAFWIICSLSLLVLLLILLLIYLERKKGGK